MTENLHRLFEATQTFILRSSYGFYVLAERCSLAALGDSERMCPVWSIMSLHMEKDMEETLPFSCRPLISKFKAHEPAGRGAEARPSSPPTVLHLPFRDLDDKAQRRDGKRAQRRIYQERKHLSIFPRGDLVSHQFHRTTRSPAA